MFVQDKSLFTFRNWAVPWRFFPIMKLRMNVWVHVHTISKMKLLLANRWAIHKEAFQDIESILRSNIGGWVDKYDSFRVQVYKKQLQIFWSKLTKSYRGCEVPYQTSWIYVSNHLQTFTSSGATLSIYKWFVEQIALRISVSDSGKIFFFACNSQFLDPSIREK